MNAFFIQHEETITKLGEQGVLNCLTLLVYSTNLKTTKKHEGHKCLGIIGNKNTLKGANIKPTQFSTYKGILMNRKKDN